MAAVPSSSSKSYRFAPTRELRASYEAVVPATVRHETKTTALGEYLKLREEENTNGEEKDYPILLPPVDTPADVECGEDRVMPWSTRLQGPLLRNIAVLRRALYLAGKESKEAENGLRLLLQSAQESPSATAAILSHHMPDTPRVEECVPSSEVSCADGVCDRRALPYSRFCLHHIAQDEDQVLYGSCTASEANSMPCGNTVFDFLLNQPQCTKHVTKAALESSAQQKKKQVIINRTVKTKGKVQKPKKIKATKLAVVKPSTTSSAIPATSSAIPATSSAIPATSSALPTASSALPTIPALSSTSSWSSGDSDGEGPGAKQGKAVNQPPANSNATDPHRLPSLTPEAALDLSLSTMPLPSLILPPPLPDIGKFMDDSSSEES